MLAGRMPALQYPRFELEFFDQLGRGFLRRTSEEFRFLGFGGDVDFLDFLRGFDADAEGFAGESGNLFFLCGHDAFERGVADLVDARLDGEYRGKRALYPLEPPGFELAFELHFRVLHVNLHDERGVRQIQQGGEKDARLAEAVIVALQAREDEIDLFFGNRRGNDFCSAEWIELSENVVRDVDATIGALGESFLDGLLHAFGAERERDDFAAVLFLQAKRFFERVGVGLVHFEADVRLFDPVAGDGERSVLGGNLFDADENVHVVPFDRKSARLGRRPLQVRDETGAGSEGGKDYFPAQRLTIRAAFVPAK